MTTLNQFLYRVRQMNPQLKLFLVGVTHHDWVAVTARLGYD